MAGVYAQMNVTINPIRCDMSYPGATTLTNDVIHILPLMQVLPPIQQEIFACNRYHLIELTKLEAKDMADAHQNFVHYLSMFDDIYHYSMLAYKRVLHIALTSFSMKQLIFVLSINATFNKYDTFFENSSLKVEFEEAVNQFKDNVEKTALCFSQMRTGFNPNNWTINNLDISKEELYFVFEEFIHDYNNTIPIAYYCSYIAQEFITSFSNLMKNIFIPMSVILNEKFHKPPMVLIRMININRIQMGRVLNLDTELANTVSIIRKEYNFWRQLQTKHNPSLYYMVMRQLGFVLKFKDYSSIFLRCRIDKYPSKLSPKLARMLDDYENLINKLVNEYSKRNIEHFTTMFSFRTTDEIEQLYIEHVSTEVRLISFILKPIHAFATKFIFINAYKEGNIYPLEKLLEITMKDRFIDTLTDQSISQNEYRSIGYSNGIKESNLLTDFPLAKALKLNNKPSVTKVTYVRHHKNVNEKDKPREGFFEKLWNSAAELFETYDARKLKGPLCEALLKKRKRDSTGRLIPRAPNPVAQYNPMTNWPLIPKEEEMLNKPGEPYNIFKIDDGYEELIQLDIAASNMLLCI